jgi:hypothetical protein
MGWLRRKLRNWLGIEKQATALKVLAEESVRQSLWADTAQETMSATNKQLDLYQKDLQRFFCMKHPNYRTSSDERPNRTPTISQLSGMEGRAKPK